MSARMSAKGLVVDRFRKMDARKAHRKVRLLLMVSLIASACGGGDTPDGVTPQVAPSPFGISDTSWQSGAGSVAQATEPFEFLAYGDSRTGHTCTGNGVHMQLVQRMAAESAAFTFHLGDMISGNPRTNWRESGDCQGASEVGSFNRMIAPLQTKTPPPGFPTAYFPVVGNHDDNWGSNWYPDPFGDGFCDVFEPRVLVANHTQQSWYSQQQSLQYSNEEFYRRMCSTDPAQADVYPRFMYYSFNFRNSHFVVLRINNDDYNLEECGGGWKCDGAKSNYDHYYNIHQLDWLRQDLAAANANPVIRHVFVFLHTPLFTNWNHPPNVSRAVLLPEFSKHKVRLVLSGHNHVYERSVPIVAFADVDGADPFLAEDAVHGTTYVVTGGGGSPLDDNFRGGEPYVTVERLAFHYVKVAVSGDRVTLTAIDVAGNEIDTYTY